MSSIRIKPADGVLVRLEDGSDYLPPAGLTVPLSHYWRRRLADGDVVKVADKPATKEKANG